jgi:hypothetical protein
VEPLLVSLLDTPSNDAFGTTRLTDAVECTLANVHALMGHTERTRARVERLMDQRLEHLDRSGTLWFLATSQLADACASINDAERAAALYEHLAPIQHLNIVVGYCSACDGSYDRVLGRLAAVLGEWDKADQHFTDAHTIEDRLESPPLRARTDLHHAEMLLRAKRPGDAAHAHRLLTEAGSTAAELEMPLVQRDIDTLLMG